MDRTSQLRMCHHVKKIAEDEDPRMSQTTLLSMWKDLESAFMRGNRNVWEKILQKRPDFEQLPTMQLATNLDMVN